MLVSGIHGGATLRSSLVLLAFILGSSTASTKTAIGPYALNLFNDTNHAPAQEDFHGKTTWSIGRIYDEEAKLTICTGTLVDPEIIVTAAHCITDLHDKPLNKRLRFIPGTQSIAHGKSAWIDMATAASMTTDYDKLKQRDVGFVRLETKLSGEHFPSAEIMAASAVHEYGKPFKIILTGYYLIYADADGIATTEICDPIRMFHRSKEFTHNCSTTIGMSGSPIYVIKEDRMMLIGVHWGSPNSNGNKATAFSELVANGAIDGEVIGPALEQYKKGQLRPELPDLD